MDKNIFKIKFFLKANTKEALILKMRNNNIKNNTMFEYGDPIKDGSEWVVWFTADASKLVRVK